MGSIGWLHLTDLHQGQGSQSWLWPNVREKFYDDIEILHNESGPWDLVFFTGDLTFSGGQQEYAELNITLGKLWRRLKVLGSTPTLLPVPGNHDLSWRDSMMGSVIALKQWHKDKALRDYFWKTENNEYRKLVMDAFSSYMDWRESCDLVPRSDLNKGILPGDFSYTFQKGELRIGIVGLNSAFLQLTGDDYEGGLDLDVRQLNAVCKGDTPEWIGEHHASFLMTHHPYSWLHPNSQQHFKAEIYIPDRFLIHLHGHMHEHASQSIRAGGAPARRYLQGSSLFGLETWGDGTTSRQHGYSAGRISIEGDQGTIKVWPREAILLDAGNREIVPHHKFGLDPGKNFSSETFKPSINLSDGGGAPEPEPEGEQDTGEEKKAASPGASYDLNNLVFFVPYQQKGDKVLGIEETLQRVRRQLVSGHRTNIGQAVAFQGLGGLGKTQLAVEYAFRFKDEYPGGVIWINADQTIDAQLIELVDQARWIARESEHKVKLAVARQRLRAYPGALIIFDNVDKLEDIEEYLGLLHSDVHILATSRIELGGFDPILLDTLDSDLSYRLLIQEANREPIPPREKEAARDIVEALGGLPLAIELAGAFLRNRPTVEWHEYRDLLNYSPRDAFLKKSATTPYTRHKTDLYSTLRINERLLNEEPRLREILDLLTWSGSAPMGKDLLGALVGVKNFIELTNALSLGLTLRLLQKTRDAESYSIHRLVREVRREDVPLKEKETWISDTCSRLGDWFQHLREDFLDLPKFDAEIDHLKAWQQNAIDYAPEHASRLTWLQAHPLFNRARYSAALELIDRAFELYEKANDLELKAHLLNDLAVVQGCLGDIQNQKENLEYALRIRCELFGERHPEVATSLNNLGIAFGRLGDYGKQLEYSERGLEIRRNLFGEKHPRVATSFNNVGIAFGRLGD
ncbi:MAG TPA: tetratricopeptide repeat protein, partial [Blastocatellia bacterium]|nr:tetratricopeptide repeat protein [Blastocatellia bacterium]